MGDTRNFRKEYDDFLQRFPYQTAVVDGVSVRYQYGGREAAPVLFFFNGRKCGCPMQKGLGTDTGF